MCYLRNRLMAAAKSKAYPVPVLDSKIPLIPVINRLPEIDNDFSRPGQK